MIASDLRLLGDFEGVIDLDAQISHCRFELGVTEQQLHGSEVLGASIDQRSLGPSQRMRSIVGTIQSQFIDPVPKNSGVLPGPQMGRFVEPAGEEEVI